VKNPTSEYAPKVCAASPLKRKRQEVEGHHFGGRATSRRWAEEGSNEGKDPRRRGNAREAATVRSAAVIGAVATMKIPEKDLGVEKTLEKKSANNARHVTSHLMAPQKKVVPEKNGIQEAKREESLVQGLLPRELRQ